jgi:hypothetical protein
VQRAALLGTREGAVRAAASGRLRKTGCCEQTRSDGASRDREPESSSHGTPFLGQSHATSHDPGALLTRPKPRTAGRSES